MVRLPTPTLSGLRSPRALLLAFALPLAACLKVDFDPESVITGVRIIATKADKPFAKPGDTVNLETLAVDARADQSRPMKLFWIPVPCINPTRDLYYVCFAQFLNQSATGASGGTDSAASSAAALLTPGADLTAFLPQGPTFSFTMPTDAVSSHPPVEGALAPYGLAIFFNIACAGHVKLEQSSTDNPQNVPLGCYDDAGNKLGPDQYVIGFTRVYAYDNISNANPVLDGLTYDGQPVTDAGIVVDHCTADKVADCDEKTLGVSFSDSIWEANPLSQDSSGNIQHEQVWTAYYATTGRFDSEIRLLFDAVEGRVDNTDNKFRAPKEVGTGTLWVVTHDNRGGASWKTVNITVR